MVETEPSPLPIGDRAALEAEVERRKAQQQNEPVQVVIPRSIGEGLGTYEDSRACDLCGVKFNFQGILNEGKKVLIPKHCPKCHVGVLQEAEADSRKISTGRRQAEWEAICPPLYRGSERDKLKIPGDVIDRVLAWMPQAKGIGLAGESGTGKTRLLFMLLRKLHFEQQVGVMAFTAKRFEGWCHRMFDKDDEARQKIKAAKHRPVILIDDLGKEKYTERVESEFYDLIEHRTSHLLPIFWTANATGQQLAERMAEDRGVPIVRRLREFSTVISL